MRDGRVRVQTKAAGLPRHRGVAQAIGGRVAWGSAVSMGSTNRRLTSNYQCAPNGPGPCASLG